MSLLDGYIARHVVGGTTLALAVLLSLAAVVGFVEELDAVGTGRYGVADAMGVVLLTLPRHAFVMFPLATVIGALIGLGALSVSSELAAVRAAGVSVARVTGAALKGALLLVVVAVLVGEVAAPYCERLSETRRGAALGESAKGGQGAWIRDGRRFVNVSRLRPDDRAEDVYVYEVDAGGRLRTVTHAEHARYRDGGWGLESVRRSEISSDGVATRSIPAMRWEAPFGPDHVRLFSARLESLSAPALVRFIDYLRDNRLDTAEYELALWTKLVHPLATVVMIVLAVPLVLGRLGGTGVGQRVLAGCLIAVTFHVVNEITGKAGIVYGLSPAASALAPTLAFLAVGVGLLRRVR